MFKHNNKPEEMKQFLSKWNNLVGEDRDAFLHTIIMDCDDCQTDCDSNCQVCLCFFCQGCFCEANSTEIALEDVPGLLE